jgi:hypothetical protein
MPTPQEIEKIGILFACNGKNQFYATQHRVYLTEVSELHRGGNRYPGSRRLFLSDRTIAA